LLSNVEKVFEKLMYSRLVEFLERHNSFYPQQFGFRQKHSTTHALASITNRIFNSLDKGQFACGVFVDLQTAFDTVDHEILIQKLSYYGIRGISNLWFKSYLSLRYQFVSIYGKSSSMKLIKHGVPQGSVLGPLLFLLYINDLHEAIAYSEVYHFADDTNLLYVSKTLKSLNKRINIDLKLLCHWLNANKISLNKTKTEYVLFKHPCKALDYNLKIKINGMKLYPSQHIKYLGVFLDQNLKWHKHVNELSLKLRRANGSLSKIRHFVPKSVLVSIYHAIFSSHMQYACQIWCQRESNITKRILRIQKAAIRLITFSSPMAPSKSIPYGLKILSIFDLVKTLNSLFVHQALNSNLPHFVHSSFNFSKISHNFNTRERSIGILKQNKVNTSSFGLYSLSFQSISCWNQIQRHFYDFDLASCPYLTLKHLLTEYYLSQYKLD
jgi:hypothetical protein